MHVGSKTNAVLVETASGYIKFADSVSSEGVQGTVNVLFDMAEVQTKCPKHNSINNGSDSEHKEAAFTGSSQPADNETERNITHLIGLLTTKVKTDSGFVYHWPTPGLKPLRLSHFMLREWAIFIHNGKATLDAPPNTPLFDPSGQCQSLVTPVTPPSKQSQQASGEPTSQVKELLSALAGVVNPHMSHIPATPTCKASHQSGVDLHAFPPSPSDLRRCLTYISECCQYNLADVKTYGTALEAEGIAPDVVGDLDIKDLTASLICMTKGDAICFKHGCNDWWESSEGKCAHPDQPADMAGPGEGPSDLTFYEEGSGLDRSKLVHYEIRYYNDKGVVDGFSAKWGFPMQWDESYNGMKTPPNLQQDGKVFWIDEANGNKAVSVPPDHFVVFEP
ncbi:hypothetical protein C8Q74DRAFT_1362579 [Fomes fomentarius]|nr:hypothetical protein C8Q74DRAFT_1362579 [Fomes fomentarius]